MKRRYFLLMFLFLGLLSCESEKLIEENSLPAAARDFISLHYAGKEIVQITRSRENITGIEYRVILNEGSELEFSKSGACQSIEAGPAGVPESVVLPAILDYVAEHFAGETITGWEKDKKIIEIELSNSRDLMFTEDGEFLKIVS
jgi:hypothetical protein